MGNGSSFTQPLLLFFRLRLDLVLLLFGVLCFLIGLVVSLSLSLKCKTETKVLEIDNKLPVYQCGYTQGSKHGDLAFLQLGNVSNPFVPFALIALHPVLDQYTKLFLFSVDMVAC